MATTKLVLFESKTLKNGEHPILIRLTKDRKLKYLTTGYSAQKEQWDASAKEVLKSKTNWKKINHFIHKKKAEVDDIIFEFENRNKSFSLESIENKYFSSIVPMTVFNYCEEIQNRMFNANRIGNYKVYKDLLRTLKKFRHNKDLSFSDINFSFLQKYEEYFLKEEVSENSISLYMRTLRALFNNAIKEQYAKEDEYPFKLYKISKLNTKTKKRAITKEDMLSIVNYEPNPKLVEWHAKNYFLFSFYCIGMNFVDIAKLKWSNIENGRINYVRSKNGNLIHFGVNENIQNILNMYSKAGQLPANYIFPILNDETHKSSASKAERIKKILKYVNTEIKAIAKKQKVKNPETITFYSARHSWATIARHNGQSTMVISAGLAHDSEKTTQIYLEEFQNDVVDNANNSIL